MSSLMIYYLGYLSCFAFLLSQIALWFGPKPAKEPIVWPIIHCASALYLIATAICWSH